MCVCVCLFVCVCVVCVCVCVCVHILYVCRSTAGVPLCSHTIYDSLLIAASYDLCVMYTATDYVDATLILTVKVSRGLKTNYF